MKKATLEREKNGDQIERGGFSWIESERVVCYGSRRNASSPHSNVNGVMITHCHTITNWPDQV